MLGSGQFIEIRGDLARGLLIPGGLSFGKTIAQGLDRGGDIALGLLRPGFVEIGVVIVRIRREAAVVKADGLFVIALLGVFLGEAVEDERVGWINGEQFRELRDRGHTQAYQ